MNLLRRQLALTLTGRLDDAQLEDIRANLSLSASGSPNDPVGTELGHYRRNNYRNPSITEMLYTLTRSAADEWSLTVDAVPGKAVDKWRCLAEIACRAAGLTITNRQLPSPPKPLTPRETLAIRNDARRLLANADRYLEPARPSNAAAPNSDKAEWFPTDLLDRLRRVEPGSRQLPVPAQQTLEVSELTSLISKLCRLVWSWYPDDLYPLAALDWTPKEFHEDKIIMDTHLGLPEGILHCRDDEVMRIEIPVATTPDGDNSTRLDETFNQMVAALISEHGTPTSQINGPRPRLGWAIEDYSLTLTYEHPTVRLFFERL